MKHAPWIALVSVACGACGAAPLPAPPAPPAAAPAAPAPALWTPKQVTEPTTVTTPSGATSVVPADWYLAERDGVIRAQDPEQELTVWIVEHRGADLDAAIATAWETVHPGFARAVDDSVSPPDKRGWDDVKQLNYASSSAEARVVIALARRKADRVYVVLMDGSLDAVSRRGAQMQALVVGLQAPGVEDESFAGKALGEIDLVELDRFIAASRDAAGVPGLSVAIVRGGKVIFSKGYGVRESGKNAPVTEDTLFAIGSISKPLTSLMMAKLVEQGTVRWDSPVTELWPAFALGDAEATKKMQLQHTVCACTGLPRQDMEMLFEYDGVDAARRLKDLEHMKPTTGFGETFQYSNPLVTAGGYIAAHAAYPKLSMGAAYDKAMRSRVLDPMGMRATTFDLKAVARANHALPHGRDIDTALRPMPLDAERVLLSVQPAGGAWSNAKDMARWAIVELRAGVDANDKRVFAEDALLERRKPRVKMSDRGSYGLALASGVKNGLAVVGHGGATMGFSANLELFVEHDLGIVVLSNGQGSHDVLRAVTRRVLELGFDGRAEAGDTLAFSLARAKQQSAKNAAKRVPPDAKLYDQYAGSYEHPTLGAVTLSKDGVFDAGEWKSKTSLIRDEDTTLLLQLVDPPLAGLEFAPKEEAGKPTLVLRTPQQSYAFARK